MDPETRAEPPAVARGLERALLAGLVVVGAMMLFRRTRRVGGVLGLLWLGAAWPAAWLCRALDRRGARARRPVRATAAS